MEAFDGVIALLNEKKGSFTDEHNYWYYRSLGVRELMTWNYKAALSAFLQAESHGQNLELADEGLYYNMAHCLTDMDYASLAIEYVEKAQKQAAARFHYRYDVYIRSFLAINYGKLGRTSEALATLEGCLRDEKEKKSAKETIGGLYCDIGMVYYRNEDYSKALEYLDMAREYFDEGSESHICWLHHKAQVLILYNRIKDGMDCISQGLVMTRKGTIWHLLLSSLKHSMLLNASESLTYIVKISIPQLLKYGQHLSAADCCEKLSHHYGRIKKYKQAVKYSHLAQTIYKKLMKGDLTL
jgi:tetratricopeptide (TPR) repeat protein